MNVTTGTLHLNNGSTDIGGSYTGAGTIDFGGGIHTLFDASVAIANVIFSNGSTEINNGSYDVSGATTVISGTVTFARAATTDSLTQWGGELNSTGLITVTGLSTFSSGTESGSGTTEASGGATFTNSSSGWMAGDAAAWRQ